MACEDEESECSNDWVEREATTKGKELEINSREVKKDGGELLLEKEENSL